MWTLGLAMIGALSLALVREPDRREHRVEQQLQAGLLVEHAVHTFLDLAQELLELGGGDRQLRPSGSDDARPWVGAGNDDSRFS